MKPNTGQKGDIAAFVELDSIIGKPGEEGEAWLSHASGTPRLRFVVKVSHTETKQDNPRYKRFQVEFDILSRLEHPNIVRVFTNGEYLNRGDEKILYPFYIMDYLGDGAQTLRAALDAAKGQSRIALCIRALLESASGLMYAHQNTVVHGDIKPSNILIAQSDPSLPKVRLIDFGFAQITDGVAKLSDRHPSADSSVRRRIRIKDPFRSDIWALAKVFQVELAAAEREITRWDDPLKASLPLDYADLPELRRLLAEWADENAEAVVETHPPEEFFRRLFALDRPFSLAPDVKRGIRFLAVDELATAARLRPAFEAIRIPPRQLVLYTERIKELISTPEFGSLRYKRQLGFTHLVYPGAQGTRFEHSIGVYDLACRFVIQMAGHASFRSLAISEKDTLKFLVASLLHDVGHYPYAHQLEEFHREDFDTAAQSRVVNIIRGHEHYGALIVRKLGILRTRFGFSEEDLNHVVALISRDKSGLPAPLAFLGTVLDGTIDLDKLDYVERDAFHCGVPYGNYLDKDRIFETLRLLPEEGGKGGLVKAFERRGIGSLEQLAQARHQLYANVYWHGAVRSATCMFKHVFFLIQELIGSKDEIEQLFLESYSDDELMNKLLQKATTLMQQADKDKERKANAVARLLGTVSGRERVLYKAYLQKVGNAQLRRQFGHDNYGVQRIKAKMIFDELEKREMLIEEECAALVEHNVLIDNRTDSFPNFEQIPVLLPSGERTTLGEEAPSVCDLKHDFEMQACQIRVFINPSVLRDEYAGKQSTLRGKIEAAIMAAVAE